MIMKKNILLIVLSAGLLSVTACKKETTVTTETTDRDTTMIIEESLRPNDALQEQLDQAEANYEKAEADVKAAAERGDKKAEEAAIKVREEAKEVGKDIEDGYNKTLDKMKTD